MPLSTLVDCTQIYVSSTGTGPLTLGAAVTGFQGREVLTDGALYSYRILTGGAAYEFGQGNFIASTNTLTRSPLGSSDGGAAISVPVNAQVAITVLSEDLRNIIYGQAAAAEAGAEAGADAATVIANEVRSEKANASALGVSSSANDMGIFTGSIISDNGTVKEALQALETVTETRAPVYEANLTGGVGAFATDYRFNVDFFNPGDDYSRAGNLDRATDTATGDGKIRFARLIDNIVSSNRTNGPAQASVGLGIRSIKPDFLTSTSTQEVDGLFVQTKTGLAGDTSGLLIDAVGRSGGTSFVNMLEGSAWLSDASGGVVKKIRYQGPSFNQVANGSYGTQFYAEKGIHDHAILINGESASDYFTNFIYASVAGTNKWRVDYQGNETIAGRLNVGDDTAGEPTYVGVIRLNTPRGTLATNGGIEFKSATAGSGYGWRIMSADLGSGNIPLTFQRRLDDAAWTTSVVMEPNGGLTLPALVSLNYANDTAAAAAGVPVGGLYHASGTVKVRLS